MWCRYCGSHAKVSTATAGKIEKGVRRRLADLFHGLADAPGHADQVRRVGLCGEESHCRALGTCTTCSPDPVDVVLNRLRHVVVHNIHHFFDVKPSLRHVRRDQHGAAPGLEVGQRAVAGPLVLVAMDGSCGNLVVLQLPGQCIGAALGLGEDQHLLVAAGDAADPGYEALPLLVLAHDLDLLGDVGIRGQLLGADGQLDGILPAEVSRHALDFFRPSCGEHDGLPVRPDLGDDLADLRLEAHVQHAVCLVQAEVRHALEIRDACLQEIQQPPRRGDDDLDAAAEVRGLAVAADAAEAGRAADARSAGELHHFGLDLHDQLASGCHDQRHRAVAGAEWRLRAEVHQRRKEVGQGLAAAGLRDADHVTPRHGRRPADGLDRRGTREAGRGDCSEQALRQAQKVPGDDRLGVRLLSFDVCIQLLHQCLDLFFAHGCNIGMLVIEVLLDCDERLFLPVDLLQVLAHAAHAVRAATQAARLIIEATAASAAAAAAAEAATSPVGAATTSSVVAAAPAVVEAAAPAVIAAAAVVEAATIGAATARRRRTTLLESTVAALALRGRIGIGPREAPNRGALEQRHWHDRKPSREGRCRAACAEKLRN
mmetsp:Transcript_61841/g.161977  ORF Transcript_61841/g.161977 Transcript_61841/m.161977 type:complete len:599 (+) Transcript_61841:267-2063(+)